MLCYVTPKEHLGLPKCYSYVEASGPITAKIAAHAADFQPAGIRARVFADNASAESALRIPLLHQLTCARPVHRPRLSRYGETPPQESGKIAQFLPRAAPPTLSQEVRDYAIEVGMADMSRTSSAKGGEITAE